MSAALRYLTLCCLCIILADSSTACDLSSSSSIPETLEGNVAMVPQWGVLSSSMILQRELMWGHWHVYAVVAVENICQICNTDKSGLADWLHTHLQILKFSHFDDWTSPGMHMELFLELILVYQENLSRCSIVITGTTLECWPMWMNLISIVANTWLSVCAENAVNVWLVKLGPFVQHETACVFRFMIMNHKKIFSTGLCRHFFHYKCGKFPGLPVSCCIVFSFAVTCRFSQMICVLMRAMRNDSQSMIFSLSILGTSATPVDLHHTNVFLFVFFSRHVLLGCQFIICLPLLPPRPGDLHASIETLEGFLDRFAGIYSLHYSSIPPGQLLRLLMYMHIPHSRPAKHSRHDRPYR